MVDYVDTYINMYVCIYIYIYIDMFDTYTFIYIYIYIYIYIHIYIYIYTHYTYIIIGCRHVNDVLLDAPWSVTPELIATLDVAVVVRGFYIPRRGV